MSFFRLWHTFRLGKYKLSIFERRTIHTGRGFKQGCGHDIEEVCHALTRNGVEIWCRRVNLKVTI